MSCAYEYISDARVAELLTWEDVLEAAERALESVSTGDAYQSTRAHLTVGQSFNSVNTMSGYLQDKKYGSLVHLFFNPFRGNRNLDPPLPVVHSEITLVDETTGVSKAMISGNETMRWITPAVSVVATKHLHRKGKETLAILGAGNQGRIHAMAFQRYFNFSKVRVWNRTRSKAENLVNELNQGTNKGVFTTSSTVEDCVSGADVIVTATHSSQTLVKKSWIKAGAHINAIGVSPVNTELDADTYRICKIYSDYKEGAEAELKHIEKLGAKFEGQVGDVISGKISPPKESDTTIFQSLGMAVQYCAICRLIYDKHHFKQ
ncbi:hypothetical protein PPYR_12732 [Photinus pyralis]|uniref:Ketimine reductase mu-crystallin n=3 Tax=Photinus pyralis TaxID=7054 RepID=A0A5N4A717_PHOPY|nr:hypothetical protein PPYR_12732 [Photinus pyralis]